MHKDLQGHTVTKHNSSMTDEEMIAAINANKNGTHLPYETVNVSGTDFLILTPSGFAVDDIKAAQSFLRQCKEFKMPGIRPIYNHAQEKTFLVIHPSSSPEEVQAATIRALEGNETDLKTLVSNTSKKPVGLQGGEVAKSQNPDRGTGKA